MLHWHRVASSSEDILLPGNNITTIIAGEKKICLGRHRNEWFAFAHTCPHAGGKMDEGYIDALGNVVCPVHRYKFNLRNGRDSNGEGYFLKTYPVETRPDGIYVGVEPGISFL